jgi:hypothetical protein
MLFRTICLARMRGMLGKGAGVLRAVRKRGVVRRVGVDEGGRVGRREEGETGEGKK